MRALKALPWEAITIMCRKVLPHLPKLKVAVLSNEFQERLPERLVKVDTNSDNIYCSCSMM